MNAGEDFDAGVRAGLDYAEGRHRRDPPGLLSALDLNHSTPFYTNRLGVAVDRDG